MRHALVVILCLAITGCAWLAVEPDHETNIYLAAKAGVVALYECKELSAEDAVAVQRYFFGLLAALDASTEAELDAHLSAWAAQLAAGAELSPLERDLIGEITAEVLRRVKLKDEAVLESKAVANARLVVRGILDGIQLVRADAAEKT